MSRLPRWFVPVVLVLVPGGFFVMTAVGAAVVGARTAARVWKAVKR